MRRFRRGVLASALAISMAAATARAGNDELDKLTTEYDEAVKAFFSTYKEGKPFDFDKHPAREYMPRFRACAEKHAGKPEAIGALSWMLDNTMQAGGNEADRKKTSQWALDTLAEDHLADPALADVLPNMRYLAHSVGDEPLISFYEKVIKANPNKEAQSWATFNLASTLYSSSARDHSPAKADGPSDEGKRAKSLFRKVSKDYAGTKAAKHADGYIFEMDNLQIGMKAPDIAGRDVDDRPIKLSDYKGRVVVIDFWGFW